MMIFPESRRCLRRAKIECLSQNIETLRGVRDAVVENKKDYDSWPEIVKGIEKEVIRCQKKILKLQRMNDFDIE